MQKTVDENAIEWIAGDLVRRDIRGEKRAPMAPPGIRDVALVDVDAQVIGVPEMCGVGPGAAAHVEHPAHTREVVVRGERRELRLRKGRHPQPVDQGLFEEPPGETHSRHRTSNRLMDVAVGYRATSAAIKSGGGGAENPGARLTTITRTESRTSASRIRAVRPAESSKKSK